MDAETIAKADAAFIDSRPCADVSFEDVATTCAKVIAKTANAEAITSDERDEVRRAHAVLKQANGSADDAEQASIDEELWALVKADAEGTELPAAAPSSLIADLAKNWAEPEATPAPAPAPAVNPELAEMYASLDLNESHPSK